MTNLHPRSTMVYRAIVDYKAAHDGNSPSYRQLMKLTGITTTSLVNHHICRLIAAGYIAMDKGAQRSLRVLRPLEDEGEYIAPEFRPPAAG
jgi:hypothetical protein